VVYLRAGIVTHYYPMNESVNPPEEKGIDAWLSLGAFDLAVRNRFDVLVWGSGDQDFVPLVRKVDGIGTRVMIIGMDVDWDYDGRKYNMHTSQALIDEASHPIIPNAEIDSKTAKGDRIIDGLFRK
jgi:uncharacterized LabA/DUF88 family protein